MFKLTIHDRNGAKLEEGDIVKISNRTMTFFSEVKYLEPEKVLTPFHTFVLAKLKKWIAFLKWQ